MTRPRLGRWSSRIRCPILWSCQRRDRRLVALNFRVLVCQACRGNIFAQRCSSHSINNAFQEYIDKQKKSVLNLTFEKLVSIDFNHNPASSIIDGSLTNVVGNNMGKISAWYDNEWGFSNRMCDIAEYINKNA